MLGRLLMASACAASFLLPIAGYADDSNDLLQEVRRTDRLATSAGGSTAAERIAANFPDTFGTPEQTRQLVTGLRDGTPQGKPRGAMGYGEIHIALALAQDYAAAKSLPPNDALTQVLAQRAGGKGWGSVAKALGLNLGQVVSRVRSGNERLAGAAKPERPSKPERAERPDKPERPARAGRS